MKAIRLLLVSFFVLSIAFTGNSMGATATSFIQVEATADVTCVIGSVSINFGTYTGDEVTQNGSFNVTCSDTTPYTISYGEGDYFAGSRNMADTGGNFLIYHLFCESVSGLGIDQECGDSATGGLDSSGTGNGLNQPFAIQVNLPGAQFVPPGTYSDQVVTTLTY